MKINSYLTLAILAILVLFAGCGKNKVEEVPAEPLPTPLELARAAFQQGVDDYSEKFYTDALTSFNQAREFYNQALPTATPADSVDVMIERTQLNVALTYMDMAHDNVAARIYDDALTQYESAVNIYKSLVPLTMTTKERDDYVAILYRNMALTAQNAGQFERALTYYDNVLVYEPGNGDILNIKYSILKDDIKDEVRAYQVLKDYAEASQDYNAFIILANAYKANGDNVTAASYFDRALEIGKTSDAYLRVADFYRSIGNYTKSNEILTGFVGTKPDNASLASAYRAMAENYDKLKNTAKKIESLDKSLSFEQNADVALQLANHYNGTKNWDRVIRYATQTINLDSGKAAAFLLRGNAYYQTKKYLEARNDLQRIVNNATYGKSAQDLLLLVNKKIK